MHCYLLVKKGRSGLRRYSRFKTVKLKQNENACAYRIERKSKKRKENEKQQHEAWTHVMNWKHMEKKIQSISRECI